MILLGSTDTSRHAPATLGCQNLRVSELCTLVSEFWHPILTPSNSDTLVYIILTPSNSDTLVYMNSDTLFWHPSVNVYIILPPSNSDTLVSEFELYVRCQNLVYRMREFGMLSTTLSLTINSLTLLYYRHGHVMHQLYIGCQDFQLYIGCENLVCRLSDCHSEFILSPYYTTGKGTSRTSCI